MSLLVLILGAAIFVAVIEYRARTHSEIGTSAIRLLGQIKSGLEARDIEQVLENYSESYRNPADGVWKQSLVSQRDSVDVFAWGIEEPTEFSRRDVGRQYAALLADLRSLESVKFKLDKLEKIVSTRSAVLQTILLITAESFSGERTHSDVTFRVHMEREDEIWRITRQALLRGETVSGTKSAFADVTDESGVDFVGEINPRFLSSEWDPRTFGIIKYGSAGVATADFDDDGWYDIFFANGARPRLYRNRQDGTFSDYTRQAGLPDDLTGVNVGIFADLDNDGDQDLFLGSLTEQNRLFCNMGNARLRDVTKESGLELPRVANFVATASASDFDNDGLTDLYLGRYLDPRSDLPTTLFYTRNGKKNSLLRNVSRKDQLRFVDVTERAGVGDVGLTLGLAWGDYNGDGLQDLYVANDFGRNALFRNDGDGTFTDASEESGTLDFGFGMSAAFGDVDSDGDLDIYVSNVRSSQRWYGQAVTLYKYFLNSVRQGTFLEDYPLYMEIVSFTGRSTWDYGDLMVKGNSLLINQANGKFTDQAEATRTNPFGWYWSSEMFDYDNDGWLDLLAVNGWISGKTTVDI